MQLAIRDSGVETNGTIGVESNFSIAVNPKMFKVLSDTMYQDKVGSIVREISCNAADAHKAAGCPAKPFEIHLPNAMEPWFAVRDEGIGLSDEDVRDMYTTYGESTKDKSNDMIGAFGLGSKTPFAYTDQFTVTSIFDGMKRVYVAVIQRGLPVLNLQDERPTDEHAGLEVHIGVRQGDYREFEQAVQEQLKFFVVKPTLINNMSGIEFADVWNHDQITFQHELLTMFDGNYYSPVRGLTFVQGGVGYPVDVDKLTGLPEDVKKFAQAIDSKGAFVEVEIGTISVTTNRESISYETDTIKGIIDTLTEISQTMTAETVKEIQEHTHLWDRCAAFNRQIPVLQDAIMVAINGQDLFKGADRGRNTKKIALGLDTLHAMALKAVVVKKYEFRRRNNNYSSDWKVQRVETSSPDSAKSYNSWNHKNEGTLLYPNDDYLVVVKDTNSKPVARLKHYMEENDFPEMVLVEGDYRALTVVSPALIAKALGISVDRVVKLSDWEAPKVTRSGQPADRRPRAYQYPWDNRRVDAGNSKNWTVVLDEIDDLNNAVWVSMDRHYVQHDDDSRALMGLMRTGKIAVQLIAVNQQTKKRIESGKIGADLRTPKEVMDEIRNRVAAIEAEYQQWCRLNAFCQVVTNMPMWKVKDEIDHPILNKVGHIKDALETIKVRLDSHDLPLRDIITGYDSVQAGEARGQVVRAKMDAEFPMLRHLGTYWNDQDHDDAISYIKLVQGS